MPAPRTIVNSRLAADDYHRAYPGAFAANDIYAVLSLPGGEVRTLGELIAVSLSTHRDTFPVTALSFVNARGFTQGHRTIAGTLIFHTIDRSALALPGYSSHPHQGLNGPRSRGIALADELPLFDIHLNYVNEIGMASFEALYGVRLIDFGKTVSLENLQPVESYSYMAQDYQPMQPVLSVRPEEETFFLRAPERTNLQQVGVPEETQIILKRGV